MKRKRTPQEKKQLSYERDCRNASGESNRVAQKAVKKRKKWVRKSYRKTVKLAMLDAQKFQIDDSNDVDSKVKQIKRKPWRKSPDMPLGELMLRPGQYRNGTNLTENSIRSKRLHK